MPTETPAPLILEVGRPTRTPRSIASPSATASATASATNTPQATPTFPQLTARATAQEVAETAAVVGTSPPTLPPLANTVIIGQSAGGRDILAWRFGTGEKILMVVGGIHGGFEANTVMLINEMVLHFQGAPGEVLPGMSLIFVPTMNPDGLVLGRQAQGRFNGNGVDLNRNWGCGWSAEAYWQERQVDPGAHGFSEPETQAMAFYIRETRPAAVLFYHSAARGVFAGNCPEGGVSQPLAAVVGEAAGYPYDEAFSAYPVTGTAPTWVDGLGIPAVDVELSGTRETEFVPNLRAVMAVQRWLADIR